MFINISPAESNLVETLSTLNFGQGISKIEMGPIKRNVEGKAAAANPPKTPTGGDA